MVPTTLNDNTNIELESRQLLRISGTVTRSIHRIVCSYVLIISLESPVSVYNSTQLSTATVTYFMRHGIRSACLLAKISIRWEKHFRLVPVTIRRQVYLPTYNNAKDSQTPKTLTTCLSLTKNLSGSCGVDISISI